jgi:hypothetical protein
MRSGNKGSSKCQKKPLKSWLKIGITIASRLSNTRGPGDHLLLWVPLLHIIHGYYPLGFSLSIIHPFRQKLNGWISISIHQKKLNGPDMDGLSINYPSIVRCLAVNHFMAVALREGPGSSLIFVTSNFVSGVK